MLSRRIQAIKPSETLRIAALAKKLQAEGQDIINLSAGEPEFAPPETVKQAIRDALQKGYTQYTAVDGIPALKQAIMHKFKNDNNLLFSPAEIMASSGCKQAIFNALLALINPGDEVIIPAPYWVSYPDMVQLAEGKTVMIPTTLENHFKITPDQLEKAITPRTKLLILNSPSNPTGMVYDKQALLDLTDVLLKYPQVFILSDDIYEHIRWTNQPFDNVLTVCPDLKNRVLICHGFSKTYAMTGLRLGYAAGPQPLIAAMTTLQSQSTSNPNSLTQYAGCAALASDVSYIQKNAQLYHRRHDLMVEGLNKIKGFRCAPSQGAFYNFVDVSGCFNQILKSEIDLCAFLLEKAGVAAVPGGAFGNANCIRLSYALDEESLSRALERIKKALKD